MSPSSSAVSVTVAAGGAALPGDLSVPEGPTGLVLFAHGSGSSRHSPRNRAVAAGLNKAGFATLLLDLLTAEEEHIDADTAALRFDIGLLARRLKGTIDWLAGVGMADEAGMGEAGLGDEAGLADVQLVSGLPLGLFGASTGAAGALAAAASRPGRVSAVVSRGGRPDLTGPSLAQVRAPALLIVGGQDTQVLELNEMAAERLPACEIRVVPGAGHLFEEPGALDEVTGLAIEWFDRHLTDTPPSLGGWIVQQVVEVRARLPEESAPFSDQIEFVPRGAAHSPLV
jgi:putative phosphoribosyl transferase